MIRRRRITFVMFMPEHVHLLVVPMDREPAFDRYLAHIKQPFSKWVKQQLMEAKRRSSIDCRCRKGRARLAFDSDKKGRATIET
jgi:hypothetical protein